MRRILTIILLAFSFMAAAQTQPPIVQGSKLYQFKNGVKIDSAFFLPRRDTNITDAAMKASGMILYRTADSLLYYLKGNTMVPLTTGAGDLSLYVRYTDTASMLGPYLRIIDTAGLLRTIPSLQQVTDVGNTTTNTISVTGSNNAPSPANGLQLSYSGGGRIEAANPATGTPTPLTIAASTVFMDDAVIGPLTTTGNAKFTGNGTPGVGKIPAGTDGTGNWSWSGNYWDSNTIRDSVYTKTQLQTQGQAIVNVNNLSYVPGYIQTSNKAAGNTGLTNQYGSSSGIGGFFTHIVGSTDYPDTAGVGIIAQRASTASSVSSRGSFQLWTSASKGIDSSLYFRKTDVNALTGNVWLPWRRIVDDFNFRSVATASGIWDSTTIKIKTSRYAAPFLRVKKLNDTVYVRSIYNDTTDLVQLLALHNANNQAVILGSYLIRSTDSTLYYRTSSTTLSTGTDNTAPLQFVYLGSISGAHGVQAISATITGHNKTSADIGSIWSDGTYQYYLAEITDANTIVFMSRPYSVAGEQGIRQNAFAASTLTYVSGGVHTSSMVSTNEDPVQKYSVTFNNLQKLIVDDRVITADSEYYCNTFQIVDRYDVVDPTTYVAANPFVWNNGSSLARMDMAYRFGENGALVMDCSIKFNSNHKTINSGLIQVQKLPIGGTFAKLFDYIPGTKAKIVGATTYNFAAKQEMTSNPAANFYLVKTDMLDSAKPANRMVQLLTNSSGVSLAGGAHGYDITYGSGLPNNRRVNNDTAIWYITTANKSYPRLQSGILSNYQNFYASAYFTFFDPKKNDSLTACYAIPSANDWLLYIDAHQKLTRYTVKVDQFLAGKRIEVVEKNDSMTLLTSDVVPSGGLIINNTSSNGYLVLRLSDQKAGGYWIANNNDVYNANSGNVGIGTTTPATKLQIVGSVTGITEATPDSSNLMATTAWVKRQLYGAAGGGGVPNTRNINTTAPLSGGGDLSADRTLSIANAAADGTTKGASTYSAADFNDNGSGLISIDYANGQAASSSLPGFVTTGNQTLGTGIKTFSTVATGSLTVTNNTSNVYVPSANSAASTTLSQYLFGGATTVFLRNGVRGSSSGTLTANSNFSSLIVGTNDYTPASTGTHAYGSNFVVKAPTLSAGTATVTNFSSAYVDDAPTGGSNNWALYVRQGGIYLGGNLTLNSIPALGTAATTFLTTNSGVVSSRTVSQTLSDLGAAPATGGAGYIQNQSAAAQSSSSFWTSGIGRTDSTFTVNTSIIEGLVVKQKNTNDFSLTFKDASNNVYGRLGDLGSSNNIELASFNRPLALTSVNTSPIQLRVNSTLVQNLDDTLVTFNTVVAGVTPTQSNQLTTKIYVDTVVSRVQNQVNTIIPYIVTVAGSSALTTLNHTVIVNNAAPVTITLPTAASVYNSTTGVGRIYVVKKISGAALNVTIQGNGTENIDGVNTKVLTLQYSSVILQSDGTQWHVIGTYAAAITL